MTNPVSHLMASVGGRVLAEAVYHGDPARFTMPGAARLVYEAMERQRLVDEAVERHAATERRRVLNTPWNVPRDDEATTAP